MNKEVIKLKAGIKVLSIQDGMINLSDGSSWNSNYYELPKNKKEVRQQEQSNKSSESSSNKKGTYPKGLKKKPKNDTRNWAVWENKYYLFSTLPRNIRNKIAEQQEQSFNKTIKKQSSRKKSKKPTTVSRQELNSIIEDTIREMDFYTLIESQQEVNNIYTTVISENVNTKKKSNRK